MAGMIQVQGVSNLISKLKQKSDQFAKGTERGVIKAGLFLQRQSQLVVPVDTGNLRAGAFTRKEAGTSGFKTVVAVGYVAAYAIYVHENLDARHKPGKIAKFLERPFRENKAKLLQIIKEEASK